MITGSPCCGGSTEGGNLTASMVEITFHLSNSKLEGIKTTQSKSFIYCGGSTEGGNLTASMLEITVYLSCLKLEGIKTTQSKSFIYIFVLQNNRYTKT